MHHEDIRLRQYTRPTYGPSMHDVRRSSDNELCGKVTCRSDRWVALTVFGGILDEHTDRQSAEAQVLSEGLASLADRWTLIEIETGDEEIVLIQEANESRVVLAIGYYSLPGVPTVTITSDDLEAGRWVLHR